eukprot:TRINITY_DN4525_c1_g8_i1.p2 TRINITY_DN4525_c1_g8~~TRINITY_DN4525_c1_g8_i1.p2  ORF type:complete len:229 (+),score=34.33 TRINITY_DN4525_c1_g8_i1:78-689(+)
MIGLIVPSGKEGVNIIDCPILDGSECVKDIVVAGSLESVIAGLANWGGKVEVFIGIATPCGREEFFITIANSSGREDVMNGVIISGCKEAAEEEVVTFATSGGFAISGGNGRAVIGFVVAGGKEVSIIDFATSSGMEGDNRGEVAIGLSNGGGMEGSKTGFVISSVDEFIVVGLFIASGKDEFIIGFANSCREYEVVVGSAPS